MQSAWVEETGAMGNKIETSACKQKPRGASEQKKGIWDGLLTKLWFGGFAVKSQSSTNFNFGMPTEGKYSTGTEAFN